MRDFHFPGRSPVMATNGMCATSHPLALRTAIKILEDGGNAVDAAIAAAALLEVCEPQMTGIGGDCFVLLKPAGSEDIVALNGSGRSAKSTSAAKLRERGLDKMPVNGVDSVTVPGAIDAFCRLSEDYGKLGIADCLAPAIHYADAGVPVAGRAAFDWNLYAGTLQGDARNYYLKNDQALKTGEIHKHPQLAEVLRRVSKEGRKGFYEGEVAEDMVASLNAAGGDYTLEDFSTTACNYTDPISGTYKGTELVEHPPNGQGATAILMANILANFDISTMEPFGSARAHLEAEAAKLAYDARNRFIADPDSTKRVEHMLSLETAGKLANLIDPKQRIPDPARITEETHKDTVYVTVVDKDRMAVSLIYSIYSAFGSGVASSKFGVLFQNRGAGFTLNEGHPNEAGGRKRPMHTIIPGMLKRDGKVVMPFGVMGGAYQPNGHVRFMSNMVDFGLAPQHAIDSPRSFSDHGDMKVERGYSDQIRAELVEMGHKVRIPIRPIGGAQSILIDHERGILIGASDSRKDGAALGY